MKTLKKKLTEGKCVIGTFVNLYDPAITEILGLAGFDFIVIDTEHSSLLYHEVEAIIRAADVVGLSVIVRTGDGSRIPILKALDSGADGVLVPMVSSGSQAFEASQNAHYPPNGRRGLASSTRAVRYGFRNKESYIEESNANTLVAVQIETQDAVDHADEIAGTSGVDILFIGPSDLSMSLQTMNDPTNEKMEKAVQKIISAAGAHGKKLGTFVNSEAQLNEALSRGMQFILWGTTVGFLASSAKNTIATWEKRAEK